MNHSDLLTEAELHGIETEITSEYNVIQVRFFSQQGSVLEACLNAGVAWADLGDSYAANADNCLKGWVRLDSIGLVKALLIALDAETARDIPEVPDELEDKDEDNPAGGGMPSKGVSTENNDFGISYNNFI